MTNALEVLETEVVVLRAENERLTAEVARLTGALTTALERIVELEKQPKGL